MSLSLNKNDSVDVLKLTPEFKLCCNDKAPCRLCLVIDAEIKIRAKNDQEDEDHSGVDEEDYMEETRNPKGTDKNAWMTCVLQK